MKYLSVLLSILIFISCSNNTEQGGSKTFEYYNVTVLLDLSDRIKVERQVERDIEIIKKVFDIFEERQKRMGYITSQDILKIAVASQKKSEIDLFGLGNALTVNMKGLTKPKFDEVKKDFFEGVDQLYEQAVNSPTTGADIYSFFKDNLGSYIKESNEKNKYHNKLIILSDGYLAFDKDIAINRPIGTYISYSNLKKLRRSKNWVEDFGKLDIKLKPFPIDIHNLQVQMLEVSPEKPEDYVNEYDILKRIWTIWFEDLGIYESSFVKKESHLGNIEPQIREFLEKKALIDKMKVPLKLHGINYKSHLLEQEEMVRGYSGKYLIIDISKANGQEIICFKAGRYVISDFNIYGNALAEFGNEIISKLYGANSINDYELFIKGTADILGDEKFSSDCQSGFKPSEICCFSQYNKSDHIYVSDIKCQTIEFPIYNKDLPNLRAYFLKERFDSYYSANFKSPILLDGQVVEYISEFDRNASIILFLSNNFLKN